MGLSVDVQHSACGNASIYLSCREPAVSEHCGNGLQRRSMVMHMCSAGVPQLVRMVGGQSFCLSSCPTAFGVDPSKSASVAVQSALVARLQMGYPRWHARSPGP
jgi:hypothetical protein